MVLASSSLLKIRHSVRSRSCSLWTSTRTSNHLEFFKKRSFTKTTNKSYCLSKCHTHSRRTSTNICIQTGNATSIRSISTITTISSPHSIQTCIHAPISNHFSRHGHQNQHLKQYHTSQLSNLALKMNVGYGPNSVSSNSKSPLPPISPAQRKAANLELQRMQIGTEQILSSLSSSLSSTPNSSEKIDTNAFVNEVKVVMNYWVSRWVIHFHPYITPSPTNVLPILKPKKSDIDTDISASLLDDSLYCDYGPNQAMEILLAVIATHDPKIIKKVLFEDGGNAMIGNLVESILCPCIINHTFRNTGGVISGSGGVSGNDINYSNSNNDPTYSNDQQPQQQQQTNNNQEFVQFSSNTGFHNVKPSIWKPCILNALHMIQIMDDLHETYNIQPDVNSYNAKLNTWSKLVTLLHILESNTNKSGLNKVDEHVMNWDDAMSHVMSHRDHIIEPNNGNENKDERQIMKIISSYCQKQSVDEVITQIEETIQEMENLYFETNDESYKPNIGSYNCIIGALGRSPSQSAPSRAEWYLRRMEMTEDTDLGFQMKANDDEEGNDANDNDDVDLPLPLTTAYADSLSYNLVINAFSSATSSTSKMSKIDESTIQRAIKADSILQRMEERFDRIKRETSQPDTFSYSTVLNAYANAGKALEAERILNKIIALSNDKSSTKYPSSVQPNIICFNSVIGAWAKTKGYASAENAYAILTQMEDLAGTYKDLYPDTISYSSVIAAFSRSGRDDAGDKAEELLKRSLQLYREQGQDGLKPDSITFISVLDALAKQCLRVYQKRRNLAECDAIEKRMKDIIEQMDELKASGDGHVRPCTVSYNILLDLYAKTSQVKKAEQCLEEMNKMYSDGEQHVKPDIISYNSVLLALVRSNQRGSLKMAESLLSSLEDGSLSSDINVQPDIASYNTVMNGLAKSDDPGSNKRVQEWFSILEDRCRNGAGQLKPNLITYNICIDSWSKSGEAEAVDRVEEILEKMIQSDDVRPDVFTLTSAISTIAKSRKRDAPERALSVIQRVESLGVKPNRFTYNNLINCWSRSRRQGGAEKAEEILIQMTEMDDPNVKPDSVTFSSVINCWAQSGEKGSGQRAEKILDLMEKAGNKYLKPNRFTYGSVLNAWAKSGDENSTQKALDILNRMEKMYLAGNDDARPTEPSYNAVISALAKSTLPTKAVDAESILNTMIDSYHKGNGDAKPSPRTYGTVLNACAYTDSDNKKDKAAAFKIARRCFKEIINGSNGQPNSMAFSLFLTACLKLVPPGTKRDQLIASVFDECCKQGMVDVGVINNIRRSSPHLRKQLLHNANLENGFIKINNIPKQWRSNLQG